MSGLATWRRALMLGYMFTALSAVSACVDRSEDPATLELKGSAMGTTYSVKLAAADTDLDREQLRIDINAQLELLERSMSTWMPDSELSLFNAARTTDWFRVSVLLCAAVSDAQTISRLTGGAFDITVGPLVNLWGFGPDGIQTEPPAAERIAELLKSVGYKLLHTDCDRPALRKDVPELYVDLSAFAKGYAVDELAALLDSNAVENYLIEIGGELRLRGYNGSGEPWAIAIETPDRGGRSVQTIIGLTNTSLATSGDYRNYFEHDGRFYSHTIDPRSGHPVEHNAASVTVLAKPAALADAMATALLVLGPDDGMAFAESNDLSAYVLSRANGRIEERMSSRFADEVERQ